MALDHAVSRAVFLAHVLERAIHDPGPWFLDLSGWLAPADRDVTENGVVFSAHFSGPHENEPLVLSLIHMDGTVVVSKPIEVTAAAGFFAVDYELALPTEVRA